MRSNITEKFMEIFQEDLEFFIGDTVYIVTDPEQHIRQIIGYDLGPNGLVYIAQGDEVRSYHYNFELTSEKRVF